MHIELTDDERRIVISALNRYGNQCMDNACAMAQKTTRRQNGQQFTSDDVSLTIKLSKDVFALQRKFHDAAEVA